MHYLTGTITLAAVTLLQTQLTNAQASCGVTILSLGQNSQNVRVCTSATPACYVAVRDCLGQYTSCKNALNTGAINAVSCGNADEVTLFAECLVTSDYGFSCPV